MNCIQQILPASSGREQFQDMWCTLFFPILTFIGNSKEGQVKVWGQEAAWDTMVGHSLLSFSPANHTHVFIHFPIVKTTIKGKAKQINVVDLCLYLFLYMYVFTIILIHYKL